MLWWFHWFHGWCFVAMMWCKPCASAASPLPSQGQNTQVEHHMIFRPHHDVMEPCYRSRSMWNKLIKPGQSNTSSWVPNTQNRSSWLVDKPFAVFIYPLHPALAWDKSAASMTPSPLRSIISKTPEETTCHPTVGGLASLGTQEGDPPRERRNLKSCVSSL